jgi:hypothetical protein
MAFAFRSPFFRGCLAFLFFGAAFSVGCYGVLVLFEAFDGHGSVLGTTLLLGLALFLLVLSPIVFIAGLTIWRKTHDSRDQADS